MTTANRQQRRASAKNGHLAPLEPSAIGVATESGRPKPVAGGQLTASESKVIRTRLATAKGLRDQAQGLLTAAEHLEASVNDVAMLAVARRGLTNFVQLDPEEGTIWVLPEPAAELAAEGEPL